MKRDKLITIGIIILILVIAAGIIYWKNNPPSQTTDDLAKCIGQNSLLYVQTGCSHCADQEALFGDSVKYLNMIDCINPENQQKCIDAGIQGTPTWIINNQSYIGVQTIAKLKELTGC